MNAPKILESLVILDQDSILNYFGSQIPQNKKSGLRLGLLVDFHSEGRISVQCAMYAHSRALEMVMRMQSRPFGRFLCNLEVEGVYEDSENMMAGTTTLKTQGTNEGREKSA